MQKMEIGKIREDNHSLQVQVEGYFKLSDITSNNLQRDENLFIDKSNKAAIQIIYEVALFDLFENEYVTFKDFITSNKKQRA